MEAPPQDLLRQIIAQLKVVSMEQSNGLDVLASCAWDYAMELVDSWRHNEMETCYVVTGCRPNRSRRIILSECTLEEARHFIDSIPHYIEPRIERVVPRIERVVQ